MAYRDPTFNANMLTDLLSTYLTHKSSEREKYYKAEQEANKPQYRTVDGNLVKIGRGGEITTIMPKTPTTKSLDTLYPVGEGPPVMTRQVGSETQYINPETEQWEIMPPDVLRGYKTDVPRTETTLPYVTWNKKTDEGYEETSILKGEKPAGEGWSVGQAPKDTVLPYVTWNKKGDGGTFEEVSVLKGEKPAGEGWSVGQAPKDISPEKLIPIEKKVTDFLQSYKNRHPNIDISSYEKNIGDINTEKEFNFMVGELSKLESRKASDKKSGKIAVAKNTIKANSGLYSRLGDDFAALDGDAKKWDYKARKREKKALQSTMDAYGINKQVYLKEDLPKLKEEYLKLIPKNSKTKNNREKIKNMSADELFDEIERLEDKYGKDLPFWLHRQRYKGFNEFENLLNSMENVTRQ